VNYQEHFNITLSDVEISAFDSGYWKVEDFEVVNGELARKQVIPKVLSPKTLGEIDCIFISYDEPNAEHNWADLLNKAPWAKRVHGVKGSDACHKAAAELSNTERFITVDADNIVDPTFFDLVIDFENQQYKNKQLSWCGKNNINGLMYGNGGLKCWTKTFVNNMRTHEAALFAGSRVDFCWEHNYQQMTDCYSISNINSSPLQAFRAGFREGVKMTLLEGLKQNLVDPKTQIPNINYQRLLIWCSVGSDVKHGQWAIFGARLGCYMANCTDWDYTQVRDFEHLNYQFELVKDNDPYYTAMRYGEALQDLGLPITTLSPEQSTFFKEVWTNPPRTRL
jgi:hypothetical protein